MKVDFYYTQSGRSPVQEFIKTLSMDDKARFTDVYEGVEKYGLEYQRATFRHLSGKLWEIKFSGEGGRYRVAYVMKEGAWMVWLHAFKKTTQKTPERELQTALKRMKEVLEA